MNTLRNILFVCVLFVVACLFVGCADTSPTGESYKAQETNQPVVKPVDPQDKYRAQFAAQYEESQKLVYGTVLEEKSGMHTIQENLRVQGGEGGHVTINKEALVYVIKVKLESYTADSNIYVPAKTIAINVVDGAGVTKETLEALVEQGTRISFPRGNIIKPAAGENNWYEINDMRKYGYDYSASYLRPDTQGLTKCAGDIRLVDPNENVLR